MADNKQSREFIDEDFDYAKAATELDGLDVMPPKSTRTIGGLTVKVIVDVSEALTGLKALQREAKEATKALRELQSAQRQYDHQYDMYLDEFEDDNNNTRHITINVVGNTDPKETTQKIRETLEKLSIEWH